MHKDSFGYKMTLLNSIFLCFVSFANFNILNLTCEYAVFIYVIPFSVCTLISNIILWHSMKDSKNQKDNFTKFLKFTMIIIFITVGIILGLGLLRLLHLVNIEAINDNVKTLYFGKTNFGNFATPNDSFSPWFSIKYYALTQPFLYIFQSIIGIIEFFHYKLNEKNIKQSNNNDKST